MSACSMQSQAFVQCRAMDTTGMCATCPPVDFNTIGMSFPAELQQKFMMTQAMSSPSTPEFCLAVEDSICMDYEANACCCEPEMGAWQSCLLQNDLAVAIQQAVPCDFSCGAEEESGGGGGGGNMIVTVIGALLVIAAGAGIGLYFFVIRKRNAMSKGKSIHKNGDDESFQDEKQDTPPSSDSETGRKKRGGPRGSRSSSKNNQRDGKKNDRNRSDYYSDNEDDIERNSVGNITDVSMSSHGDRKKKKRYEDEDSISNNYGENMNKYRGEKKKESKSRRGYGNNNDFDDDDISELNDCSLDFGRNNSRSKSDLPNKIQSTRKISSRELKSLMRDKEESSDRMRFMEEEMAAFEKRLARRNREAEELRRDKEDQERRIQELEAANARLKEREGDGYGRGQSSRSKASIREGNDDGDDRRERTPRSRSASGRKSLGPRSASGRSLGRNARSPSSSRGLGKQASTMRRTDSRNRLDRNGNGNGSSMSLNKQRSSRSKSPRSYLRDSDP